MATFKTEQLKPGPLKAQFVGEMAVTEAGLAYCLTEREVEQPFDPAAVEAYAAFV